MNKLTADERAYLQKFLTDSFSTEELKVLTSDLGLDYEAYPYESQRKFVRELISHFERKTTLNFFLIEIMKRRPDQKIAQLLDRFPVSTSNGNGGKRVQLTVSYAKPEITEAITKALAQTLGVPESEIKLIEASNG